ncbi:MAG: hypothetical protein AAF184_10435 [Pseudomonadota bacterium]
MSYDAFISYKHSSELPVATALDDGLARFAKPWHKLRARRVYRDLDSQALTPNLLAAVQSAMDASEYLILLASPESAASPWVPAEVAYWIANRPLDRMLIVVCAGNVAWDNAAGDFDWEATDCLPQCLRGRYKSQPLYLDLRWARGQRELGLENAPFKEAVARLSATLGGVSLDDMLGEEVLQFRRAMRIRNVAIAALSSLFVAASVFAVLAVLAQNRAERQRDRAVKNSLLNEVRNDLDHERLAHAVQVARVARERFGKDDPKVQDIAWEFVRSPAVVLAEFPDLAWDFARYSPDGSTLMVAYAFDDRLTIEVRDRFGGGVSALPEPVHGARFIGDGSRLLVINESDPVTTTVEGVDARGEALLAQCGNEAEFAMDIHPGGLGFRLAPRRTSAEARIWNIASGEYEPRGDSGNARPAWFGEAVQVCDDVLLVFTPAGELQQLVPAPGAERAVADPARERFAVQDPRGTVLMDADGVALAKVGARDAVWSADGTMLAMTVYGELADYLAFTGRDAYPFKRQEQVGAGPVGDQPDAELVVTGQRPSDYPNAQAGNGYTVVMTRDGEQVASVPGTHAYFALGGLITTGGFAVDDTWDRHPRLWSLEPGSDGRHEMRLEMHGFHAVVSPNDRWIASGDEVEERTWIWDAAGRYHGEVEGGLPVFHPVDPVLTTNHHGYVREWHLPRLPSASGEIVRELLGIEQGEWERADLYYGNDDCRFDCTPPDGVTVDVLDSEEVTVTGGTNRTDVALTTTETLIVVRRADDRGDDFGEVQWRVEPCDLLSQRFRDDLLLLACARDETWRIYDLAAVAAGGETAPRKALASGHQPLIQKATLTPDGRQILSLGEDDARLWDWAPSSGSPSPPLLLAFGAEPQRVVLSSDSRLLAMLPFNGAAQLWDLEGQRKASIALPTRTAYYWNVGFFNGHRHVVTVVYDTLDDSENAYYVPRILDFDELFRAFDWVPALPQVEYRRLGLE